MTRKECSEYIKTHKGVADLIKQAEGKNWTNCKTEVLATWCKGLKNKEEMHVKPTKVSPKAATIGEGKDAVYKLIEVLFKKRILVKAEVDYITKN